MIYHIVTGDAAATPLLEAIAANTGLEGEVIVMRDVLNVGPLQKEEGQKFSELRSAFWNKVINNDKVPPAEVDDMERLLQLSADIARNEEDRVWLWMAPWPADICTYYWTIKYLGKYPGRFMVLNIAGLPFLDENGKIFYPKNVSEIPPKELLKARRLARPVSMAEVETDGEEWRKLTAENTGIRTLDGGGKKITSRQEDHYDAQLSGFCTHQYQKASKIINQALSRYNLPTGDIFLGYRLRCMIDAGKLQVQGEMNKTLKDFDIKLPGDGADSQLNLAL